MRSSRRCGFSLGTSARYVSQPRTSVVMGNSSSPAKAGDPVLQNLCYESINSGVLNTPLSAFAGYDRELHRSAPCGSAGRLTGKSETLLSSPLAKNIPLYALVEAPLEAPHPVPHEGRIAIVTDVGHGMRWTRRQR